MVVLIGLVLFLANVVFSIWNIDSYLRGYGTIHLLVALLNLTAAVSIVFSVHLLTQDRKERVREQMEQPETDRYFVDQNIYYW